MSAEAAAFVRSWRVGKHTVTLTIPKPDPGRVLCAAAEGDPEPPSGLSAAEWKQYTQGRRRALAELAREFGITVAVLDV